MTRRLSPRLVCLLALALFSRPAYGGAAGGQARTAERQECRKARGAALQKANSLLRAGKPAEAAAVWEKQLARERGAFGRLHEQVVDSLTVLARIHELGEDLPASIKACREILAIREELHGGKDWRVVEARLNLAHHERLARMDRTERRRLEQTRNLTARAGQLRQQGRSREALPLVLEALATRKELLGEAHPLFLAGLNNVALIHADLREYGKSITLQEQAVGIARKVLGEGHPVYADTLRELAVYYQNSGAHGKARDLAERVRGLRKAILGVGHPDYADSLHLLAGTCVATGDYLRARELYEQALRLRKKVLGEGHPDYADTLNDLARLLRLVGEFARARELAERACELRAKLLGEAHPAYAVTLGDLALIYGDTGQYAKALALAERARALTRKALGEDHPNYATCLYNLGALAADAGQLTPARAFFEQARDHFQRAQGEQHPNYLKCLNALGILLADLGEYAPARELLEKTLALQKERSRERHPQCIGTLNNLAVVYWALGERARARSLAERALGLLREVVGEAHPDYLYTLCTLVVLHRGAGEYARARDLAELARDRAKEVLGESHPRYATFVNNLANVYRHLGDQERACTLYEQARALCAKVLGVRHPQYAQALINLAPIYGVRGEHDRSRSLYEQASRLFRETLGERHPHYAETLLGLAWVSCVAGEPARAREPALRALRLREQLLADSFAAQSERQRLDSLGQHRYFLDIYVSAAVDAGAPVGQLYGALLTWRGALVARRAEERLARRRPELAPLAQKLRAVRADLARLAGLTPATASEQANWRKRFDRLEREKEELEVLLAQKSTSYLRWREARQATPSQVANAIPPDTALVEFVEYIHWSPSAEKKGPLTPEPRLLAFVLARGREPALVRLGPTAPINKAVHDWRQAVLQFRPLGPAAAKLSRLLWQPLRKHLAGARAVLIAPDGSVVALPFAALPGAKAGTYLLEELALGYVTSGRHLLELPRAGEPDEADGLVAVGGLRYGEPPANGPSGSQAVYHYLPGTRLEVERLGALYRLNFPRSPAPRLLGGESVDVAHFKAALGPAEKGRPRYLHLATHGLFEAPSARVQALRWPRDELLPFELAREYRTYARNPLLLSGLVLAGANQAPAQGILRAEEVAGVNLRGCQLVALSACDTGLGRVAGGEGVLGLQRAFHAAGARSVVASLWKVSDAATSVLMEEFYANLWQKKLPRLEALRQAQLAVLRDPDRVRRRQNELRAELTRLGVRAPEELARPLPPGGPRSHPALWAAFVLSGDTGPVPPVPTAGGTAPAAAQREGPG
jgi:CHAT domain-containing protein/Tfp pilus assembly protein PilF